MKYLIYQYYCVPEKRNSDHIQTKKNYWELSKASVSAYAMTYGFDYKFLNQKHTLDPFYGILTPFEEGWCNDYDAVCFLDSDMLVSANHKNVFENAAEDCISGMFMNTSLYKNHTELSYLERHKGHMNTGTVVIPRSVYQPLTSYIKNNLDDHHKKVVTGDSMVGALGKYDQAFFNLFICHERKSHALDEKFNWHLTRKKLTDHRWDATFIHYHRKHKESMHTDWNDERIFK